jgi:hypothetical protein
MRQPWLDATSPYAHDDDFSPRSATRPVARVGLAFAIAVVVLVCGTSSDLANSVLNLPIVPGTDTVIAAATRLHDAMHAVGLDRPHDRLRELERALEGLRFSRDDGGS